MNSFLLSLPPAGAGPCKAGEPSKAHRAPRQPGMSRLHTPAHFWDGASRQPLLQGSSKDPDQPDWLGRGRVSRCLCSTTAQALPPWVEAEPGGCRRAPAASPVPAGSSPAATSKLMDLRLQMPCGSVKTHPPPPSQPGSGPVLSPWGTGAISLPVWVQNKGKIRVYPSHGVHGPDPRSAGMDTGREAGTALQLCFALEKNNLLIASGV